MPYPQTTQIMWREKPSFRNPWHFCLTDFSEDEWLCRICDRFSRNEHKPVLYRKWQAVRHEESLEHADNIEKLLDFLKHHPEQYQKYIKREYGEITKGDPLFPDEVYESLGWHVPDARFGEKYLNQFVEFWISDVATACKEQGSYPEPEETRYIGGRGKGKKGRYERRRGLIQAKPQECQRRRTFAEFFDSLESIYGEWAFRNGQWVKRNEPDAEGWITQIGKTRPKKKYGQVERVASGNRFALLQGDHNDGVEDSTQDSLKVEVHD